MVNTPLRVLVCCDGPGPRFDEICSTIAQLGHDLVARTASTGSIVSVTEEEHPDVALAIVRESTPAALQLIDALVREAACPVIAILDVEDADFISQAAQRGIFAHIANGRNTEQMQSSISIVLRRFAEYHDLEGAFGRRARTERAKGILMERHGIDERAAFEMLRSEARRTHQKLITLAEAVVAGHMMLSAQPRPDPEE